MSSLGTAAPLSASTFRYLMRWPVWRLSWLNEIFSFSEVAGYGATGQVTSESLRNPFQLARGAMIRRTPVTRGRLGFKTILFLWFRQSAGRRREPSLTVLAAPAEAAVCLDSYRTKREHW